VHCVLLHFVQVFLYGGYFKDANVDKDSISEKGVVHADMWVLDPRSWEWNKVLTFIFYSSKSLFSLQQTTAFFYLLECPNQPHSYIIFYILSMIFLIRTHLLTLPQPGLFKK
jgi:hypothetical protein